MVVELSLFDGKLFEQYLLNQKGLMDSSVRTYVGVINQFLVESHSIDSLDDYNSFIVKYGIKKRCSYYYNILRVFINWRITDAAKKEYLLDNLVKPQKSGDLKYERKYLSEEKIFNILNSLKLEKHRIIALIQTLTGVRAGDVMRLKIGSILPEEYEGKPVLRINVLGKGNKRNVVFIHDEVAQKLILNYISSVESTNNYLFLGLLTPRRSRGLGNDYLLYKQNYLKYWEDLKQALQSNGVNRLDFATHDFRRCFARRAWERWHDVHVLQGLLNHARPDTTLLYLSQSGLKNIDYLRDMQK